MRLQRRRGVSEVVGMLLMLAIVVTLGALVYAFASGGMKSLSENYANAKTGDTKAASEKFLVEQVTFTTSGTEGADVYVRNVGGIQTTLVSVYITDTTTDAFVSQSTISVTVDVGTFADIPHATLSFTPVLDHTYSFTVTSSLGNSVVYDAEAI